MKAEAAGSKVSLNDQTKAVQSSGENAADEAVIFSVVGEPEGRDFLLFHESPLKAVFPEDFEIGPVQPLTEMDENESAIYKITAEFAASVIENDPDSKLVYSGRRAFVMRNLDDILFDLFLTDYRLGIINTDSEPARADLRFFGKDGFVEGTIYFIREGSWMIYDLQLTVPETDEEEKVTNEKWFPLYNKVM